MTGAGGFVGANLVRRLLHDGHEVAAAVRGGGQRWRLEGLGIRLAEVDVADAEAVSALVGDVRPDRVFHLAAHGAYSWQTDRRAIYDTNLLGTANVLAASADAEVGAIMLAGSSSEYGFKAEPMRETGWP